MEQRKAPKNEDALVEELRIKELLKQIQRLQQLPKDFRDMEVGGKQWNDFKKIMGRGKAEEMRVWAKGGVLCVDPCSNQERSVLEVFGEVIMYLQSDEQDLADILLEARELNVSFVYAANWSAAAITGLNWLASKYGWNIRFKGQLMSQLKGGVPLGVQI